MSDTHLFGIDFGTSFSTACWWNPKSGIPEVIRNEHGEEKTPSLVYHGSDGVLVGKAAADQLADSAHMSPEERQDVLSRTFQGIKRRLGENLPLALPDGAVITPVELTAEILKYLKRNAEQRCFNAPVLSVVLTHPVMFAQRDKDRLVEASELAGFTEAILIEEPVAAVLGYMASGAKAGSGVLVFDLGGGTLDLAFVKQVGVADYPMILRFRCPANA